MYFRISFSWTQTNISDSHWRAHLMTTDSFPKNVNFTSPNVSCKIIFPEPFLILQYQKNCPTGQFCLCIIPPCGQRLVATCRSYTCTHSLYGVHHHYLGPCTLGEVLTKQPAISTLGPHHIGRRESIHRMICGYSLLSICQGPFT